MSYVAVREFTPMIGKDAVLEDRILRTSDVIEKYRSEEHTSELQSQD